MSLIVEPPVHPHAHGDDVAAGVPSRRLVGSPPRPWGRSGDSRRPGGGARFTPTPVGTISRASVIATPRPVHPHARGDDSACASAASSTGGSPPRPWGRWARARPARPGPRFTPTPVGTMAAGASGVIGPPVHPHARGDDGAEHGCAARPRGSPPRPWGRLTGNVVVRRAIRFTPTPVGTMRGSGCSSTRGSVHPHARGDDIGEETDPGERVGSPPRPWGRFPGSRGHQRSRRFTPTPVGTISVPRGCARWSPVHPHARGDDIDSESPNSARGGSPPRPWGRLFHRAADRGGGRFTPTPVGTMKNPQGGVPAYPVHPHARGDDLEHYP